MIHVEHDIAELSEFRERSLRQKMLPRFCVDGAHIGGLEVLRLRLDTALGDGGAA